MEQKPEIEALHVDHDGLLLMDATTLISAEL